MEDEEVHGGSQVVDVGHKDVLFPLCDEFVQQPRVVEAGIDVSVTWGVPGLSIVAAQCHTLGDRKQRLLVDPRIPERR